MRFPSLTGMLRRAAEAARRFPLPLLAALLATVVMILLIEGPSKPWQPRLLGVAWIALSATTAATVTAERRGYPPLIRVLVNLFVLLGLALLYLASLHWSEPLTAIRFAPLALAGHLLVAVGPWLGAREEHGLWQFNRILLLRWLVGVVFAAVLWAGLCGALLALDKLFGVPVRNESYPQLWAVFAFGFHPWFVLAGIPRDFEALETLEEYPAVLKVFAQFVLIPLVTVYLVILTAYLGKVLVTRAWPSGWIGYLVSLVSVGGVLALLLVHPIRARADSGWVNAYGRWWFVAVLPSLAMLLAAIGKRVGQYGMTEPRFFLLVLAVWMVGIALFYALTSARTIRLIPASLGAVALLATAGPWSATSVSLRSQRARFDQLLRANNMGSIGHPRPAPGQLPVEARRELSAVLRYLEDTHGASAVASAMGTVPDSVQAWPVEPGPGASHSLAGRAMARLGVPYAAPYVVREGRPSFWVSTREDRPLEVEGYQLLRNVTWPGLGWIGTAVDSLRVEVGPDSATAVVRHDGEVIIRLDVRGAVLAALGADSLVASGPVELADPIVLEGSAGGYRVRLVLRHVMGEQGAAGPRLQGGGGSILASGLRRP